MAEPDYLILYILSFVVLTASYTDLRWHLIPNDLPLTGIVAGLITNIYLFGLTEGGVSSIAGMLIGLCAFLPFYIKGAMAAGDVKLMSAVGACLGVPSVFFAILLTLIFGCFLGLIWLARLRGLSTLLKRYIFMGKYTFVTGSCLYLPPAEDEMANSRFPYALAIALGSLTIVLIQ